MSDPIIVSALFPDEPAAQPATGATPAQPATAAAPAQPAPAPTTATTPAGPIPSDEDVSKLGAGSRDTYASVTAKLLDSHKSSDLGEMSGKLNELIVVAKGLDINSGKKGLVERAMGFVRSEREQILIHMQSVQGRLNALNAQIEAMVAAEKEHVRTLNDLQQANLQYHEQMKAAAVQADQWLVSLNAEIARPADPSDTFAAPKLAALQQRAQRLERSANDFRNAMTLAKQEALTIQMETGNCQILLDEFERSKTIVLPALQSIVAQQLIQIDQKHGAETDAMLRSTLDAALRTQAQLTGDNSVELAKLQQGATINTATLIDCEQILDTAAAKVRDLQATGRQARLADAANRTEVERRLLARFTS